ncbi:right-handed parallel beta-helix repeat-containing protein [Saccharicrinis sp. FJH54]|uniref:right-handed parallel beta-helix repeat-containing protein n=1 Tax=Saccharicrinis sp. FJH54 TaxID=3344665 RepID=UPI0035D4E8D2
MNQKLLIWIFLGSIALFTSCVEKNVNVTGNLVKDVNSPTTLTADKEWTVEGYVNIISDLIIEPGTVIKFKEDASLNIGNGKYGSLKAIGTADKPIIFTSASSNPEAGDWDGVYFYDQNSSTQSELSYCKFMYGGQTSAYDDEGGLVELYDTDLKITNCTFSHINNCGIYLNTNSEFVAFEHNRIEDCGKHLMVLPATAAGTIGADNIFTTNKNYGILVTQSEIKTNVEWKTQTVPFFVHDWISVNGNNAVFIIHAGTVVKFNPYGAIVNGNDSNGKFLADGLPDSPVIFTSAASVASKGDWQFIQFGEFTSAGSGLNYAVVEYGAGAYDDDEDAVINIYSDKVSISHCTIRENEGYGIYIWYDLSPDVNDNIFSNNNNADIYKVE